MSNTRILLLAVSIGVAVGCGEALGADNCVSLIQRSLKELAKPKDPGPADGALGQRTVEAAAYYLQFAGSATGLPQLSKESAGQWCQALAPREEDFRNVRLVTFLGGGCAVLTLAENGTLFETGECSGDAIVNRKESDNHAKFSLGGGLVAQVDQRVTCTDFFRNPASGQYFCNFKRRGYEQFGGYVQWRITTIEASDQ
jgi:hypothetical protein